MTSKLKLLLFNCAMLLLVNISFSDDTIQNCDDLIETLTPRSYTCAVRTIDTRWYANRINQFTIPPLSKSTLELPPALASIFAIEAERHTNFLEEYPPIIASILIANNTTVNITNNLGNNTLELTAIPDKFAEITMFVINHAKVNAADFQGVIPLHYSDKNGTVKIDLLVVNTPENSPQDKIMRTPFEKFIHNIADTTINPNLKEITPDYSILNDCTNQFSDSCLQQLIDSCDNNTACVETLIYYCEDSIACVELMLDAVEITRERNENIYSESYSSTTATDKHNPDIQILTFHNGFSITQNILSTLSLFIENNFNINAKSTHGETLLHFTIEEGHMKGASLLIANDADVNAKSASGETPLHKAVSSFLPYDENLIIPLLIENNADINAKNFDGLTPLHIAARNIRSFAISTLIENGANINERGPNGKTLLHYAVQCNRKNFTHSACNTDYIEDIIGMNTDVNAKDNTGKTPLLEAVRNGLKISMISVLINSDADIRDKDNNGNTVLHHALKCSHEHDGCTIDYIKSLIQLGADINEKDDYGKTVLHLAVECSHEHDNCNTDYIETLIQLGADVNEKNDYGKTALQTAIQSNANRSIISLLKKNSSDAYRMKNSDSITSSETTKTNTNSELSDLINICGDLFDSIESKNTDCALQLIDAGADINEIKKVDFEFEGENYSNTIAPLHFAVLHQNTEVTEILIENGANINARNDHGETALHWAGYANTNLAIVSLLIENNANINALNDNHTPLTPLQVALKNSANPALISLLIENNSNLNVLFRNGSTPLHMVISRYNNPALVSLLIENGADIHARTFAGVMPLHEATEKTEANLTIVSVLIQNGANVNATDYSDQTPLHLAITEIEENYSVVSLLIEYGANVDVERYPGSTPLYLAIDERESNELISLLIKNGANINSKTENGETPLHLAASQYDTFPLVSILIKNGADVNAKKHSGETPLHKATDAENNPDVVAMLIANGANVNNKTNNGKTPLHLAAWESESPDVVTMLIQNGADVNAKDKFGNTPLSNAQNRLRFQSNNFKLSERKKLQIQKIMKILVDAGADYKFVIPVPFYGKHYVF